MKYIPVILICLGTCCLLVGLGILLLTYYQIIGEEVSYKFFPPNPTTPVVSKFQHPTKQDIVPVNEQFGIVIPKIRANSKIIPNVDPYNSSAYQWALTQGVAQAKGSSLPYESGNMFLFSHSSVNFYEAVKYNSIFYLLDKLQANDKVYVFYKGQKYVYDVTGKKIVDSTAVSYLSDKTPHTLTLMTCWPPGTSWKRLLVTGTLE